MQLRYTLAFGFAALALEGCAARQFAAIPMVQPGDETLTCRQLADEIAANQIQEDEYKRKDKAVEGLNAAKTVAAMVPVPGMALAVTSDDFSNEEQVKARSLADRNDRLAYLAKKKECSK